MGYSVWATSGAAPGSFCATPTSPPGVSYPEGDTLGQAGWDAVIGFDRARTIATNLAARTRGRLVDRLALNAHGDPGHFDLDSKCTGPLIQPDPELYRTLLSVDSWAAFEPALAAITPLVASNGTIILMGCNAGRGPAGSALLMKLSAYWAGRTVVAFTTVGATLQRARQGEFCQNPGMRDTDFESAAATRQIEWDRYGQHPGETEPRLYRYRWASESSPHAKVAKGGVITHDPEPHLGADPAFIVGSWGWKQDPKTPADPEIIIFRFTAGGGCSWQGFRSSPENADALRPVTQSWPGSWRVENGKVKYEFPSDAPGWKRLWTVDELGQVARVSVTINGQPHGNFEMNKRT